MTAAGFPVPSGFVLTTAAYGAFVQAHGLQQQIIALASTVQTDNPQSSEAISEKIRALFLNTAITDDITTELFAAFDGQIIEVDGNNGIVRLVATD